MKEDPSYFGGTTFLTNSMTKSNKKKTKRSADPKKLSKHLDSLYDRLRSKKPKAKLLKKRKSNIPGFGYWFSSK